MNGDLIAEKEYKDMANGGVKTWQWLKNLFRGGKEMSDDEFIEALSLKISQILKIQMKMSKKMLKAWKNKANHLKMTNLPMIF